MSQDDVLFGYRLQLFDLAGRIGVSQACRSFGIHRSTYYRWKAQVDRHGLEMLRPRERRRPRMPNQLSPLVEERIVAFALGHPGLGPRRIAAELARPRWGGILVSHNGVWRCLRRHGLSTRRVRFATTRTHLGTPTLQLTLPVSGAPVRFFVAGEFGRPSAALGDATIEARSAGSLGVLARSPSRCASARTLRSSRRASAIVSSQRSRP